MTEKHWIKFYGVRDLITHSEMEKVRHYVEEFNSNQGSFNLNEVIQLHNILKYLQTIGESVTEKEKAFQGKSRQILGRYFAEKGLEDLNEEYAKLYKPYREDFWTVFVDFGVIKKTTVVQLEAFAKANDVYIGSFLAQKAICEKYKVMLKTMLLKMPKYFELFLKKYDSAEGVNYAFPIGFTSAEISDWARRYCELPDANTNYLQQLAHWSNKHEHKIEDKVLLKAIRAYNNIIDSYSVEDNGASWGVSVTIKPGVSDGIAMKQFDENVFQMEFDQDWFDNEQDYPTLLQNFIYVFEYFDKYGRFTFMASENEPETFLDHFKTRSKYAYKETLDFKMRRSVCKLSFFAYYDYLAHNGIDIEELFSYCFNELFVKAYNNDQFFFHSSPVENSYYTRSKALLPELDSILKQFDMYQQDGEIDSDLFELKSTSNGYRSVKSLSKRKFVYLDSDEMKGVVHLLFGGQSPLSFLKNVADVKSFYDHVRDGVMLEDFGPVQQGIISETLESQGFIGYDVANRIYFRNMLLVNLYKIIYAAGYCSTLNFFDELLQLIDEEVQKGNLQYGDTLFSEQESDYISYIMDDKKYSNTLAIRNKITHGSYAKKSSKEHKDYYLELLMICMMYTIRINDELNYQDLKKNPDKTD